jgi:hypothetical protein
MHHQSPQTELMRHKAMGEVMTGRWKKYRLLLSVLLIVVTLCVVYVGYSARFSAAVSPRLSSFSSKSRAPTAQIHGLSLPDVQAGDSIAKTSSSAVTSQNEKTINEKSVTPITTLHAIDKSVKGQTFEISASVKEGCKSDTIECPLVMASVKRMAEEPRDIDWAAKMEATIQSAFDSQGSDKFVIRNVECRTSICILEVEVHVPGSTIRYDDAIFSSLRPHATTIGVREYDSSGASYHIELRVFERR